MTDPRDSEGKSGDKGAGATPKPTDDNASTSAMKAVSLDGEIASAGDKKRPATRDETPSKAPRTPAPAKAEKPARSGGGIGWLALFIALGAAGASGYQWFLAQQVQPVEAAAPERDWQPTIDAGVAAAERALREQTALLEARIDQLGTAVQSARAAADSAGESAASAVANVSSSVQRMAGIEGGLRGDIQALDQRFDAVQGAVSTLADTRQSSEGALLIAEAEFLVRMAGERLELFQDPATSIRALELAESYLQVADDPLYSGARRTLAGEIEMLRSIDLPDVAQLSGRLRQLAETSVNWPLDDRRTLDRSANVLEPTDEDSGWWARLREVVSGVAVVHRDTGDGTLLLTLDEERLLRENLQLQLQIAQLACIRGDQELFTATLETAGRWIETYYDLDSLAVNGALEDIGMLSALDVAPEVPPLGETLKALRRVRAVATAAEEAP